MTPASDDNSWQPTRPVELVAGTPPGGGQDRPARALLDVLEANDLVDQPVSITNLPGQGGAKAWDYLRQQSGDAHVLAINSPTIISNKLLGVSPRDFDDLTPLCNLYTEYPIFITAADSSIADFATLEARLRDPAKLPITLATALGNPNHIALARLTSHAGGDVGALDIAVFDSAPYAIAHVIEGKAELGVITAVSAVPELQAGSLRTLTISAPTRLGGLFAEVPTLIESGIDCDAGMWRGVIAPPGISRAAVSYWDKILSAATATDRWQAVLAEKYWANTYVDGEAEHAFLERERNVMRQALGDLALLPA
jgi:putative tricarboxylic transport membrane protein